MDNVFIERLWRSLKYECVYLHAFETDSELRAGLNLWTRYYNARRPHSALTGQTPDEAYHQIAPTPRWRHDNHPGTSLTQPPNYPNKRGHLSDFGVGPCCEEVGSLSDFGDAPAPHWEADYGWAAEAEVVHGISRATLAAEGVSAAAVARHVAARFGSGGKDTPPVISDAVPHDQRWMDILLGAAGVAPNNRVRVHGFSAALALGPVDEAAYAEAVHWMQAQPVRHRALADAQLLAEVYRRSLGPAR